MLSRLKVLCLVAAAFMIRPTFGGQTLTAVGMVLSFVAVIIHAAERNKFHITKRNALILLAILLFWFYLALISVASSTSDKVFFLKAFISNTTIAILFSIALSDQKTHNAFFRSFVYVIAIGSLTYWFTVALSFAYPIERFFLFRLHERGYYTDTLEAGSVYFPSTIAYQIIHAKSVDLIRNQWLFREAGIAQMFFVWSFIAASYIYVKNKTIKLFLILGALSTLSTVILLTLPLAMFINVLAKSDRFNSMRPPIRTAIFLVFIFTGAGVGYYAIQAAPFIGIAAKSRDATVSVTNRLSASTGGLSDLERHPLGTGLYSSDEHNAGINYLGASQYIGIPGILLLLAVYFAAFYSSRNRYASMALISPIFITGLFSQPIIDAPLVYVLLFFNQQQFLVKRFNNI